MLSDKKKAFARGILQGLSNKDAAIQAGYSENSAAQQGSRLAKEKEIISYIEQLGSVKEKLNENPADFVPVGTTEQIKRYKDTRDPLQFLLDRMDDEFEEMGTRMEAAKAALPYVHSKKGDIGVKENRANTAEGIAKGGGKFSTMKPPTLN
ncbi:hypothetical protein B9T11_07875 [Wohlfahrtiimonas chitiniclastica]|uniref:terminase small subunit n=1 Tax=Wohlfahrtiimonas chitiniclastica TaxID=400946 RepID=UPI000B996CBF|nr:terminase small subunit [Wohlfahrtiimonas chitiniclastica]MBS7819636.1 terminase small subunit [Wohlfahrtiimonas chitiniclastica]MBS7827357.1 terminase small subunit [Wohlfahrtiimonas chitiniclastica]MBS7829208.1 terminase small subunit [Wohlfahrtiimonas chitiniclastica]MBS7837174.1 terminase small subunit [Wohlfahrtiimonas chitiniclastica]OYQ71633.1 hypothetical protein B9T13_02890 [Wohlfahrtiimonas chitiniclastica]